MPVETRSSLPDARAFRNALGQFPTGVTVVTATAPDGELLGMTMSSFNSLSLEPALVLFSIDRRARSLPQWLAADNYAIHVVAESQKDISNRFARPQSNKWSGLDYTAGRTGAPALAGAAAIFHCRPHRQVDAGDHVLFIAEVEDFETAPERRSLVFCQGRYQKLEATDDMADLWPLSSHY